MPIERVETLIVGAGQAGLAMSAHLSSLERPHLVVERHRVAERWRSERWDSLVANGPAWHDRFPTLEFAGVDPGSFPSARRVVEYFEEFAERNAVPLRCGVEVTSLRRGDGADPFLIETSDGLVEATNVVAATGPFQRPVYPPIVPSDAVTQLHSSTYRNPSQLPDGAVLVVGAGSSGSQIADELLGAGRKVYLSVGPHDRPPRSYRGYDNVWWLGVLGMWDATEVAPGREHVTIAVSGQRGGHTVDFRKLAARGMTLLGSAASFDNGVLHFADDLGRNLARGDANYLSLLDDADAYVAAHGLDLPEEPAARLTEPDPPCVNEPVRQLRLADENITTIVWATGYELDFSWIGIDVFDERGRPVQQRGVTNVPGLYFLGLPWLSRRASAFIWGVWRDAEHVATHLAARMGNAHT